MKFSTKDWCIFAIFLVFAVHMTNSAPFHGTYDLNACPDGKPCSHDPSVCRCEYAEYICAFNQFLNQDVCVHKDGGQVSDPLTTPEIAPPTQKPPSGNQKWQTTKQYSPLTTDAISFTTESSPITTESILSTTESFTTSAESNPITSESQSTTESIPVTTPPSPTTTESTPITTKSFPSKKSIPTTTETDMIPTESKTMTIEPTTVTTEPAAVITEPTAVTTDSLSSTTQGFSSSVNSGNASLKQLAFRILKLWQRRSDKHGNKTKCRKFYGKKKMLKKKMELRRS